MSIFKLSTTKPSIFRKIRNFLRKKFVEKKVHNRLVYPHFAELVANYGVKIAIHIFEVQRPSSKIPSTFWSEINRYKYV